MYEVSNQVAAIDQHERGRCAACYLVVVLQIIEDRVFEGRERIDLDRALREFESFNKSREQSGWDACGGGFPEDVVECFANRHCKLEWVAPLKFVILQPEDVQTELRERGTVGLYVDARLVRLTNGLGVVTDACAVESGFWEENHCVACVGWNDDGWVCRNSWGSSVPVGSTRVPWNSLPQRPGYFVLSFLYPPLEYFGEESVWFAIQRAAIT